LSGIARDDLIGSNLRAAHRGDAGRQL
jgi:hypothetical protein